MRRPQPHAWLASALISMALGPVPALADWPNNPYTNVPLVVAPGTQDQVVSVSDGAGGAIVAWEDYRSGGTSDVYAQHVLASGVVDPAWPANGRGVCTAVNNQFYSAICSDGAGGAFLAWHDNRGANYDIYAQHLLANGTVDPAWPVDGRAVCTAAGDQANPSIVTDGSGGILVAWQDARGGAAPDIYAHHVLGNGTVDPAWPVNGRALCTAANDQSGTVAVTDGAGGAIVAWTDSRTGALDIYAQRVRASGVVDPAWPVDGRGITTFVQNQITPRMLADGIGGAYVVWADQRTGQYDIMGEHVFGTGALDFGWPANGALICGATSDQLNPILCSDGTGGMFVTWADLRSGNYDVYATHWFPGGASDPAWPANGLALCTASGEQSNPFVVPDGFGGVIATWQDARTGSYDVYAQHALANGTVDPVWPANGRALSLGAASQQYPAIVSDGNAGAIVAWPDLRSANNDVYAQRVARFGYLGTPEPSIASVRDVPNDQGGVVKLSWNASYPDLNSDPNVSAYDILRSVPPAAALRRLQSGAFAATSAGEMGSARSGAILTSTLAGQTIYWELVGSVNALHYVSGYSDLVPTAEDSTGSGAPTTMFMVVARNASGSMFWLSAPDSGYSVDNLAPATPSALVANAAGTTTYLHWVPNTEPDFAQYRVYRGSDPAFVPGPGTLLASPPDTGYADTGALGGWYKVSAVDAHGNESGFATVGPGGTTDAGGPPALSLRSPRLVGIAPNPMFAAGGSAAAQVTFELPRATRVTLVVCDVRGARLRRLVDEPRPAGASSVSWDGRDDLGRRAPAGLYFVRLVADGRVVTGRIARLP